MANHKSALKAHNRADKQTLRNRVRKSRMNTMTRKFRDAIKSHGSKTDIQNFFKDAVSTISKAAAHNTIHPRKAGRLVSALTRDLKASGNG